MTGKVVPEFELEYGPTARPISMQLMDMGLYFDMEYAKQYDDAASSIEKLRRGGYLTKDSVDLARVDLTNRVRSWLAGS
jgi:hypothetical protein